MPDALKDDLQRLMEALREAGLRPESISITRQVGEAMIQTTVDVADEPERVVH